MKYSLTPSPEKVNGLDIEEYICPTCGKTKAEVGVTILQIFQQVKDNAQSIASLQ
jgi:hypothetical protein